MLSYRKLAMRVLGRPLHTGDSGSPRPASQRAAAFILTAAMLTTLTAPAFAGTWCIEDGNITVKAGDTGNDVTQKGETTYGDTDTIITNQNKDIASSNTVTIETNDKNDKVEVTLKDVNIDASSTGSAAVSVTGKGDTNIELDGDNELKSGAGHAGLEHNKTDTSGELTIQDKNKNGSLTATAGSGSAGIGGSYGHDGEVTISGGTIDATSNNGGAGIGGGKIDNSYVGGNGTVKITGGNITAKADGQGAGIGGGYGGNGTVEITGGDVTATGGYSSSGIGGGAIMEVSPSKSYGSDGDVTISGGTVDATGGDYGAGIGGGYLGDGKVNISGNATIENAKTGSYGAGIGGGGGGNGDVTVSGNATIENAEGGKFAAGIGGGYRGDGNVTISGNAKIDNVSGGKQAAGIGSSFLGDSTITIKDNAAIGTVTGGSYGAGVGGGALGVGDVTIEGNVTIKNAQGGSNAAGIGGGYGAENDEDGNGNQITIKSNESGAPTVNATGGVSDVDSDTGETIPGGAGIGSGLGDAKADITLEGKVTITATAGKDNVAIGANGIEQEFSGLAEGTSITRYDSEENDVSLPGDKVSVAETSSGGSAGASVQESVFPGLVVTDKDGQRISYTSIRGNNVLSIRAGRFTASLRVSLAALRQLRAEGIETITFQTILCSTTLSVDELLAMGGEDTEVVLTHHIRSSTLTVGGKAV
ncbi:MAG: hypothetical protein ACLR8G_07465 [Faecalibacterium prausnitzii]